MPRAVREQQMMDAAVRVFGRYGYQAASMDGTAEAAGVSKPLVHLYLTSKEDLFTACLRFEAGVLMTALRAAVDPEIAPERQLRAGLTAFFEHTTRHPESWTVLDRRAHAHGEPFATEAHQVRRQLVAYVTDLIGAAARGAGRAARSRMTGRPGPLDAPGAAVLPSGSPNFSNSPLPPASATSSDSSSHIGPANLPNLPDSSSGIPSLPGTPDVTDGDLGAPARTLVGAAEELARWPNETAGANGGGGDIRADELRLDRPGTPSRRSPLEPPGPAGRHGGRGPDPDGRRQVPAPVLNATAPPRCSWAVSST